MSWAAVAAAGVGSAIGGGFGLISAHQNRGRAGTPAQYIEPSEYGPGHALAQAKSQYAQDIFSRLSAGQDPMYWAKAKPTIQAGMQRDLYSRYYGGGLQGPGIMGQIGATGAMTGVGPKGTMASMQKAAYEYDQSGRAIDEYLAKLGVDFSQQAQQQALGTYIPTHVGGGMVAPGAPAQAPYDWSGAIGQMGQALGQVPWGDMFQPTPTPTPYADSLNLPSPQPLSMPDDYWGNYNSYYNQSPVRPTSAANSNIANELLSAF